MKKTAIRLIALVLSLVLVLSGCESPDFRGFLAQLKSAVGVSTVTAFSDMVYTRPDMGELEAAAGNAMALAESGDDFDSLMEAILTLYEVYDRFSTNYNLAYIYSCRDLSDLYWSQEQEFCSENAPQADAALEDLLYALADSPFREELEGEDYFGPGYFDPYEGDSPWDETYLSLMEREASLVNDYYDLSAQALEAEYYSPEFFDTYGEPMGEVLADLVRVRQEIAAYAGYPSYQEYIYAEGFARDYTPEMGVAYLEEVRQTLAPLYGQLYTKPGLWDTAWKEITQESLCDYLRLTVEAMGGVSLDAYGLLQEAGLYDLTYNPNKYDASFEVYLPAYQEPFLFLNPTGAARDQLTLVHEFGHFSNDYASYGSYAGIDVAEIFSQGMEYLSLCYGPEAGLAEYKMADSLCVYVEQAAFAAFEHALYSLPGESLTAESIRALYEATCESYGLGGYGWDSRDYVLCGHFFMAPMYVISYVVSNDAALQLYQLEQAEPGSGLRLYQENLSSTEGQFLAFLEAAGLESPFAPGRLASVRDTIAEAIGLKP